MSERHSGEKDPKPVLHLDADLCPTGWSLPCPSIAVAVLGFPRPTKIPCGLLSGHDGPHRYLLEWSDSGDGSDR